MPENAVAEPGKRTPPPAPTMDHMPPMLAYTLRPSIFVNNKPYLEVGVGQGTWMAPDNPQEDSYWFCIFSAQNPRQKIRDWVLPGSQNSTIPPGIDTYMANPDYLFAVATQTLSTLHVPQGALFDFLTKYGAGRELQKLEQLNAVLSCGSFGHVSYALTGQCGPREAGKPQPPSYERGEYTGQAAMLMMSLMPQKNGSPPWSICDSYTWKNPPALATEHMAPMLAYTLRPSIFVNNRPYLEVGVGQGTAMYPDNPQEDSYWFCIFNAQNPRQKIKDWVLPGSQNSSIPDGIDTYMANPNYLFAVATQTLSTLHVPQGALFDFLTRYGAGRELQKLEQLNAVLSCGSFGHVSYALTGQCGPREAGIPAPPSYERGEYTGQAAMLMMSLMPMKDGSPPWSICDSYTWKNPPPVAS